MDYILTGKVLRAGGTRRAGHVGRDTSGGTRRGLPVRKVSPLGEERKRFKISYITSTDGVAPVSLWITSYIHPFFLASRTLINFWAPENPSGRLIRLDAYQLLGSRKFSGRLIRLDAYQLETKTLGKYKGFRAKWRLWLSSWDNRGGSGRLFRLDAYQLRALLAGSWTLKFWMPKNKMDVLTRNII